MLAFVYPPFTSGGQQNQSAFVFDGNHDYQINCASTPTGRAAITSACHTVLTTLGR
jgi:hypothetical protein